MKLYEILAESKEQIDEAPMGMLSRAGHTIASKLGSKTSAAKLDVGTRANEIFDAFRDYALRAGVDLKMVSTKQLSDWFKKQGLPAPNLGAPTLTYDLTKGKTVQDIFNKVSQNAFAKGQSTGAPLGQQYNIKQSGGGSGGANSFKQIKAAIAGLTPQQKAQLKAMI